LSTGGEFRAAVFLLAALVCIFLSVLRHFEPFSLYSVQPASFIQDDGFFQWWRF